MSEHFMTMDFFRLLINMCGMSLKSLRFIWPSPGVSARHLEHK